MYKKLAKTTMVILAVSMFILSACGNNSQDASSTIKTLNVGTEATFAPFEYMKKGNVVGFDVDLLNAVAKEAGYKVDIKNTGWDAMLAGVQGSDLDIGMAGITVNKDRLQTYDFSNPYFESTNMIVMKKGTSIKNANDLIGKKVGVQNGTTGQSAAESILGKNNKNISKYETTAMAFMSLENGDVDAVVNDNTVVNEYVKNNKDKNVVSIEDREHFKSEFYGIMFPKGSNLKPKFDKALTKVLGDGTYEKLYKKWFGKEPDVNVLKQAAK
jgi:glutamine transport system substrate-binding protein